MTSTNTSNIKGSRGGVGAAVRPRAPLLALALTMALAAMAGLGATPAHADDCADSEDGKKEGKNFHIEYRNGQKITVIDTVVTVCGKVPRPSVVYVLQPKSINYEWESLKQDFLPLILETLKKAPF